MYNFTDAYTHPTCLDTPPLPPFPPPLQPPRTPTGHSTSSLKSALAAQRARLAKYATQPRFNLQSETASSSPLPLPPSSAAEATASAFAGLLNASIARSTWSKYQSGVNAFACFEAQHCTSFPWPLTREVCRAFAAWCHHARKLQPSSIKSYLVALKFVHHLKGLPCSHLDKDPVLGLLLKGSLHLAAQDPSNSSTRRVVTFPLLLVLGHRIAQSDWDPLSKQVIFAACTTGFFASTRMGEILASETYHFDPSSNLTWNDVTITSGGSLLLRLKQPKSGEKEGEFVDLFPFPGYNCCPVKVLRKLEELQLQNGIHDLHMPVFRFPSGAFLTTAHLNKVLATLLQSECTPGKDSISCHSFRAGIPSTVSMFPELASSDLIKGWGRWKSECYTLYTRLQLPQRANIFSKIAVALRSVQPPAQNL